MSGVNYYELLALCGKYIIDEYDISEKKYQTVIIEYSVLTYSVDADF